MTPELKFVFEARVDLGAPLEIGILPSGKERRAQGGSSELLSPEQQREMDAYFLGELKRLGSDLPYEEFADVTLPLAAAH